MQTILIAGVSGAIGGSMARALLQRESEMRIIGLCRQRDKVARELASDPRVTLLDWDATSVEGSLSVALRGVLPVEEGLDSIIFAAGVLHGQGIQPEKRIEDLDPETLARVFQINATGFAQLLKALMPWLQHRRFKRVVAISAKVGSITDNRFGGWYAYRSSKAALNMLVKTLSVELSRRCKPVACVALHPGTTQSPLSEPFARSLAQLDVHTPAQTAANLLRVMDELDERMNGTFLSWDGSLLEW